MSWLPLGEGRNAMRGSFWCLVRESFWSLAVLTAALSAVAMLVEPVAGASKASAAPGTVGTLRPPLDDVLRSCGRRLPCSMCSLSPSPSLPPLLSLRGGSDEPGGEDGAAERSEHIDGAAMDDWAEVAQALEEMKRELKVHVTTVDIDAELEQRLWACTHLKVLVITGGTLKRLPPGIAALRELSTLIVSGNALVSLPAALAELPNLRVLEAEDNSLAALPDAGGGWPALEVLNVARNQLTSLAPIASAEHLLTLKADGNALEDATSLPIKGWLRLKTLCLGDNKLTVLPPEIGKLVHLEALDVRNNLLKVLPVPSLTYALSPCRFLTLIRLSINSLYMYVCTCIDLYICVHVCVYMNICIYICVNMYIWV